MANATECRKCGAPLRCDARDGVCPKCLLEQALVGRDKESERAGVSGTTGDWSRFQPTLWSVVLKAGDLESPDGVEALEQLCGFYRGPIYAFLRRCGQDRPNAEDLTQGFFAYLVEKELLRKVSRDKGRFRSFLLGTLKNYTNDQRRYAQRQKRGGQVEFVCFDELEECYLGTQAAHLTPEKLFDYHWASTVLEQAMDRLRKECAAAGTADTFAALEPCLVGASEDRLGDLALRLQKTEGALRAEVCRLRKRYRAWVKQLIRDTVSDPEVVEEELKHLKAALMEH